MAKRPTGSAGEVFRVLREKRYEAREWAMFREVRNVRGFSGQVRSADAIALNLWPSRGHEIHGIEIKVSRSDWKHELSDPAKADAMAAFCDRWWLAVSDESIVQPGELPPTWGLYVVTESKVACKVEAPKLEAQPLTKQVVINLIKRYADQLDDITRAAYQDGHQHGVDSGSPEAQRQRERVENELKGLQVGIEQFEQASGVKLAHSWDKGAVGAAVKLVLEMQRGYDPSVEQELERLRDYAQTIADRTKQAITNHRAIAAKVDAARRAKAG